jgi:hypothetical protein
LTRHNLVILSRRRRTRFCLVILSAAKNPLLPFAFLQAKNPLVPLHFFLSFPSGNLLFRSEPATKRPRPNIGGSSSLQAAQSGPDEMSGL